ncbi:endonuclease/exonuclease/phosphatase family protein [Flavimaricola marinus]|uniref:Endonuclease/Exonuclease/phosphatase family protein n=1 Tax=Flavimaricola marinus TaxID=1819565 RepID=A0A238LCC5_9RHOB|nr:endonuclease/exonuclease/phosphatase family protein [Flavimaricola marinus]SMY07232.1 Endonuclease/Exonuclease/phosphatase family protein [Flavimaricola marinus]
MLRAVVKGAGIVMACVLAILGILMMSFSGVSALPARIDGTLRVATHNVHYIILNRAEGAWSVADWERRKDALDAAFKVMNADLVAFQEMESFAGRDDSNLNLTLEWLLSQNPGYAAAAVGDFREFPSTQPILFRRDRLELLDQGWFFFSDTPDVIYSRTFNGSYPAFASWAEFRDRSNGEVFRVYNVHFEYSSRSNRLLSAALVRDRMLPFTQAGGTAFLLGDLNAWHGSATMQRLEAAGVSFAPVEGATYHLNRGVNLFGAIDHIGATPGVRLAADPVVLRYRFDGEWPSDHYPVLADYWMD